jgi:hypothetical protein
MGFCNDEVDCLGPIGFDMGSCRIKVKIVGNYNAGTAQAAKEDMFSGTALMGRQDVFEPGELLHLLFKAVKGATAGVAFIALHHRSPLGSTQSSGTGVGQ